MKFNIIYISTKVFEILRETCKSCFNWLWVCVVVYKHVTIHPVPLPLKLVHNTTIHPVLPSDGVSILTNFDGHIYHGYPVICRSISPL